MPTFSSLFGFDLASILTPSIQLAEPFIISAVKKGLSANQIGAALTSGGIGVRRADLLKYIKVLRTSVGLPGGIAGVKAADYPIPSLIGYATYPTKGNYTYIFRVTGTSSLTGDTTEQFVSVSTDEFLTTDAAFERAGEIVDAAVPENYATWFDLNQGLTYELDEVKVNPMLPL